MQKKVLLAVLLVVCTLAVVFSISAVKDKTQPTSTTENEDTLWGDESYGINAKADEDLQNYKTIAIYGLDKRNRSDIIMLFCINKETNKAKVVSVYRDTYMQLSDKNTYEPGGVKREFFKCNHAYKYGGKYESVKELNRHLDTNIRECFGITWDGVAELVNEYGGMKINVTEDMLPWMNSQLSEEDQLTKGGFQILNGWQTVQYLRCRKDAGADAATRAYRNTKIFKKMFELSKDMNKSDKLDLLEAISGEYDTNMSKKRLAKTIDQLSKVELEDSTGWPYDYSILWQDDYSFYYYVPETLKSNVERMHKEVYGQSDYEPSDTVKALSEEIEQLKESELRAE